MAERFIPCLMKTSESCEPGCPNHTDAEKFRDLLEKRLTDYLGRAVTDEEIIIECARIDPLLSALGVPDRIANSCPKSSVSRVEMRPLA